MVRMPHINVGSRPAAGGGGTANIFADFPVGEVQEERPRRPIGVPEDYRVPGPTVGSAPTPPLYFAGAEWEPAKRPPWAVAGLQEDMVRAGLLNAKDYRRGAWDAQSANAYEQVLAAANASGRDAHTMLGLMIQGAPPDAGERDTRPTLVLNLTHPDDIRSIVNRTAVSTIGRRLRPEETESYVAAYQQAERERQRRQFQWQMDPANAGKEAGEVAGEASLSGDQIEDRIRSENPQEAFDFATAERHESFMNLLKARGV